MNLRHLLMTVVLGLMAFACSSSGLSQARADDTKTLQGLWRGAWGGGERDGTIFQPVIAEMVVEGDRVELRDFPQVTKLSGTVRLDAGTWRMRFTPKPPPGIQPVPQAVEYTYELGGDKLTLREGGKIAVSLQKLPTVAKPLANIPVEFFEAAGFNEAGDLLVNRVTALQANATGNTFYQSEPQTLRTKQATIFVVQETELKSVTLEAARQLVRKELPVVVAMRPDDRPPLPPTAELWKDVGSAAPDSAAALQTYARLLRPGTLVFVLSARENIPQP